MGLASWCDTTYRLSLSGHSGDNPKLYRRPSDANCRWMPLDKGISAVESIRSKATESVKIGPNPTFIQESLREE